MKRKEDWRFLAFALLTTLLSVWIVVKMPYENNWVEALVPAFVALVFLIALILNNKWRQKQIKQMYHLQKMESLGRLAGGVAHDYNNMLAGIQGAAEYLRLNMDKNSASLKYIDIIIKTCSRASHLTSQLLFFAREKEDLIFAPMSVKELLTDAQCLLEHALPTKIELKTSFTENDFCIRGNKNMLQSVLLNLIFNARDALPEGGVIELSVQRKKLSEDDVRNLIFKIPAQEYVEFGIKDNGCGMSQEVLNKIFEPFFTTKEAGKGTGLGLPAVYGIVREHKGSLKIESFVGKGTNVFLYFPLCKSEDCSEEVKSTLKPIKAKVLVVDDEKILLELLKDILSHLGCEVVALQNPEDLLNVYDNTFDLVMLDVLMPRLTGVEVYQCLLKKNPQVKVIFMSGYSKDTDVERIVKENKNVDFVQKPYSIEALQDKIEKIM